MIDGGFDVGDMVLIKSVNTDTLKKDDIIVFYKYKDPADNQVLSYVKSHKIEITLDRVSLHISQGLFLVDLVI